jgi:uncharacterized Zn finger protein
MALQIEAKCNGCGDRFMLYDDIHKTKGVYIVGTCPTCGYWAGRKMTPDNVTRYSAPDYRGMVHDDV